MDMKKLINRKPSPNTITKKCDRLEELYQELDAQTAEIENRHSSLLDEYQEYLEVLAAETGGTQAQIDMLEKDIKADGKIIGATVETPHWDVIYTKGRQTWDSKGLDGYAAAGHPEIQKFKKTGTPGVKLKRKDPKPNDNEE